MKKLIKYLKNPFQTFFKNEANTFRTIDISETTKLFKNPFKNYRQAFYFLMGEINKKTMLSNYTPTNIDYALFTIFKSERFFKIYRIKKLKVLKRLKCHINK